MSYFSALRKRREGQIVQIAIMQLCGEIVLSWVFKSSLFGGANGNLSIACGTVSVGFWQRQGYRGKLGWG